MTVKGYFSKNLLDWNATENTRIMPWKGEKDPYKIWISEIILQQTRVEQGLNYYKRFISRFPNVKSIAVANENEVFKVWEGLGYYSRCKNIILTARYIFNDLENKFPSDYHGLLSLRGIGQYTASAIASFAYNLPYAVTDGNVFRVLSRFFGIGIPIDNSQGKIFFLKLANELLDKKDPASYNQAIMDFGATVCKPALPLCSICPLQIKCVAFEKGLTRELPVKEKSIVRRNRWIYYLVIEYKKKLYLRKRSGKDIWENLYEFVPIESERKLTVTGLLKSRDFKKVFNGSVYEVDDISKIYQQQLTHQTISGQFIRIKSNDPLDLKDYTLASYKQLLQLPFPKFISTYLKD
jgi:A/G-specific adenine glycosylase